MFLKKGQETGSQFIYDELPVSCELACVNLCVQVCLCH